MPTATPYYGSAAGNGFPFCPERQDVDTFAYWTTFSGVNKNNVNSKLANIGAEIAESRRLAWKLFWNLHKLKGLADQTSAGTVTETDPIGVHPYPPPPGSPPYTPDEPIDRVCYSKFTSFRVEGYGFRVQLLSDLQIRAMYFGGQLIGYGQLIGSSRFTPQLAFASANTSALDATRAKAYCAVGSGLEVEPFTPTTQDLKVGYTMLGDIHVFCVGFADDFPENEFGDSASSTIDVPNLTVTSTLIKDGGDPTTGTARIDSIEFYNQ